MPEESTWTSTSGGIRALEWPALVWQRYRACVFDRSGASSIIQFIFIPRGITCCLKSTQLGRWAASSAQLGPVFHAACITCCTEKQLHEEKSGMRPCSRTPCHQHGIQWDPTASQKLQWRRMYVSISLSPCDTKNFAYNMIGPRCNCGAGGGVGLSTCLCIHAEENALLEAGKERIREEAILYCDT